ncbi:hypothetical protein HDU67_005793 [Dinochytrium kinnereticum]|nr:hypothetical protein HDU67_005793 [Dinochytrium kinnereticum]
MTKRPTRRCRVISEIIVAQIRLLAIAVVFVLPAWFASWAALLALDAVSLMEILGVGRIRPATLAVLGHNIPLMMIKMIGYEYRLQGPLGVFLQLGSTTLVLMVIQLATVVLVSTMHIEWVRVASIIGHFWGNYLGALTSLFWFFLFGDKEPLSIASFGNKKEQNASIKGDKYTLISFLSSYCFVATSATLSVCMLYLLPTAAIQVSLSSFVAFVAINLFLPICQMFLHLAMKPITTTANQWVVKMFIFSAVQFPTKFLRFSRPIDMTKAPFWLGIISQVIGDRLVPRIVRYSSNANCYSFSLSRKVAPVENEKTINRTTLHKAPSLVRLEDGGSPVDFNPTGTLSDGETEKLPSYPDHERLSDEEKYAEAETYITSILPLVDEEEEGKESNLERAIPPPVGVDCVNEDTCRDEVSDPVLTKSPPTLRTPNRRQTTIRSIPQLKRFTTRAITVISKAVDTVSLAYSMGRNDLSLSNYMSTLFGFTCTLLPNAYGGSFNDNRYGGEGRHGGSRWKEPLWLYAAMLSMDFFIEAVFVYIESCFDTPVGGLRTFHWTDFHILPWGMVMNFLCAYAAAHTLFGFG